MITICNQFYLICWINFNQLFTVFGMLNRFDILVLVCILKTASANIGANDKRFTFPPVSSYSFSLAGIEFVTITWSNIDFLIF